MEKYFSTAFIQKSLSLNPGYVFDRQFLYWFVFG